MLLVRWTRSREGYVGVSWGKDSVVLADLAARVTDWPLVWVRQDPLFSPECIEVRNAFLPRFPDTVYDEVVVTLKPNKATGGHHLTGSIERGFREAVRRHGPCHVSGIRADEAALRMMVRKMTGGQGRRALAPLIDWTATDVFAHLAARDLPVHPAYAMSGEGTWGRNRIRVASLTGRRGTEFGRRQWEETYYPEVTELF